MRWYAALFIALALMVPPQVVAQQPLRHRSLPDVQEAPESGWERRLLTGLGGAALGAALGFFASQIDRSDWAETPGQTQSKRGLWSAVGGGLGFVVGVSFPLGGRRGGRPAARPGGTTGDRSVLRREEILAVSAENAWDVVRQLRPEWLNARPPTRLGDLDEERVPVYLDDFRFGEVESLRQIHVDDIELIRFVPASVATARWGVGHPAGVIQVVAAG